MEPRSFVTFCKGKVNILINEVGISAAQLLPFNIKKGLSAARFYNAIWDTGATNTCITRNIVNDCNLEMISMRKVKAAGGTYETGVYLVDLFLPNKVYFPSVQVTEFANIEKADILIGMDIIGSGDFAVTNKDNKTVFSYRCPSIEHIDFTKGMKYIFPSPGTKIGRNDPCPCGSGKKYKYCHGKS